MKGKVVLVVEDDVPLCREICQMLQDRGISSIGVHDGKHKKNDQLEEALPEVVQEFYIQNKLGIHSRPMAMFMKISNRFKSTMIFVEKDGERVNGKSAMGLMMLAAGLGSQITIRARGVDAKQAVEELGALLKRKFDEE